MSVRFGIVGTGYAANARADALSAEHRSEPLIVAGHNNTSAFATSHGLEAVERWQDLVINTSVDVVIVANVSSQHGEVVEAALNAGKHVVVEYPLSLDLAQAQRLVRLAAERNRLLHVEHIELLGGLHIAMRENLSRIGKPGYVSYQTLNPQHPAPTKWTYDLTLFGFPFCGALSRVHRLTNLFGRVEAVSCCTQLVGSETNGAYLRSILSSGRLQFESGVVAEVTYGKGENLWGHRRAIALQGSEGAMLFDRNKGVLITAAGEEAIAVAPRKGLFIQDTKRVLDYLTEGTPLYVSPVESVYALAVGDALRRASVSGETVRLDQSFEASASQQL